jgi:hypothetical protein
MKIFYFVGGPKQGQAEEFFRRLAEIGGSPAGWQIFPHRVNDGKALHIVETDSQQDIMMHLDHFGDIYEHSEIIEIQIPSK